MATQETPGAVPGPPAPEAPEQNRAGGRFLRRWVQGPSGRFLWPAICLFQLGLIAGGFTAWGRIARPPVVQAEHAAPQQAAAEPNAAPQDSSVAHGDQLVREGNYDGALTIFQPMADRAATPLRDFASYRVALCQEGLGRWQEALSTYRKIADGEGVPASAAQLGQARIWIRMRRPQEAMGLLCALMLRSGQPALREHPLLADAHFLEALALALEALQPEKPAAFVESPASHTATDWPIDRGLDWVALGRDVSDEDHTLAKDALTVRRTSAGASGLVVHGVAAPVTVPALLDRLAELGSLRIEWTTEARRQAAGRSAQLAIEEMPLPDVLRGLAEPLGLVWRVEEPTIHLATEQETSRSALKAYHIQIAKRALREAILAYPGHSLTPAAYLEVGNLEAAEGHLREAISWYTRLARELPRSTVLTEAYYNLGLAESHLGERATARNAFYRVVDRAPGHELSPLAYLRIGRLLLEEGDPAHAIAPLRRALTSSVGTPTQPVTAITLAIAHLLAGNPRAASDVLLESRDQVNHEPYRRAAAFVDALSRYRAAVNRREARRESPGLLATLLAAQDDSLLGPAGQVLAGQAFTELGMAEQAMRLYEKTLSATQGPLAEETTFVLAECLYANEQRDGAVQRLAALASREDSPWASRAKLRLADIAVRENRPQDCLQWCRQLIKPPGSPEKPAALKLMGRAFEQTGDTDRAARCFAGQMPDP